MDRDFAVEPPYVAPTDPRLRWVRWAAMLLLLLGMGACITTGAGKPADPEPVEARLPGFGEVAIRVDPGGAGAATLRCALLAATDAQRTRGLMGVTDLRGYVGMLFRFASDSQAAFTMRSTPMPLSIAFFDAEGGFVSATDMAPCEDRPDCPVYGSTAPYRYALEVPQGELPSLGIGPGSRLHVLGPCDRA